MQLIEVEVVFILIFEILFRFIFIKNVNYLKISLK